MSDVFSSSCSLGSQCLTDNLSNEVCECPAGTQIGQNGCTDIKECAANPCVENTDCTEIIGSYSCKCKSGFSGSIDGKTGNCTENISEIKILVEYTVRRTNPHAIGNRNLK